MMLPCFVGTCLSLSSTIIPHLTDWQTVTADAAASFKTNETDLTDGTDIARASVTNAVLPPVRSNVEVSNI